MRPGSSPLIVSLRSLCGTVSNPVIFRSGVLPGVVSSSGGTRAQERSRVSLVSPLRIGCILPLKSLPFDECFHCGCQSHAHAGESTADRQGRRRKTGSSGSDSTSGTLGTALSTGSLPRRDAVLPWFKQWNHLRPEKLAFPDVAFLEARQCRNLPREGPSEFQADDTGSSAAFIRLRACPGLSRAGARPRRPSGPPRASGKASSMRALGGLPIVV